jgi:hypothetical protein
MDIVSEKKCFEEKRFYVIGKLKEANFYIIYDYESFKLIYISKEKSGYKTYSVRLGLTKNQIKGQIYWNLGNTTSQSGLDFPKKITISDNNTWLGIRTLEERTLLQLLDFLK